MIANPNDGNTPQVEQATPQISVSAAGLITATAEQQEGYVPGGTKSSTKQLTTQAAKTVTPTTTNQTAVASGRYTTGAVTVKGDANLKAENIAEGVSIFGIAGTFAGGGPYKIIAVGTMTAAYEDDMPVVTFSEPAICMIVDAIDQNSDNFSLGTKMFIPGSLSTVGGYNYVLSSDGMKFRTLNGMLTSIKIVYVAIG